MTLTVFTMNISFEILMYTLSKTYLENEISMANRKFNG